MTTSSPLNSDIAADELFSDEQQQALARLGLPLWHRRRELSSTGVFVFRQHQWLVKLSHRPAQSLPRWLDDLYATLGNNQQASQQVPAEVSESTLAQWSATHILDLTDWQGGELSPQQKQALWQQISQA